jgi:hypothetical protein
VSIFRCIVLLAIAMPVSVQSQQVRDDLDVIDGPNPTLRYGFYTEPSGQLAMGRYYFIDDGDSLRVSLVPYGRTAVDLPVKDYDRDKGVLELGWDGKPGRSCRLARQNDELFLGNCIENSAVMPIAIRVANEYDSELQGLRLPVTEADLAIVARAIEIMESQGERNVNGDRNCDDDLASGSYSVFCALYAASIETEGVYRHRRAAIQAARDSLRERFPGDYAHTLRDINNNAAIGDKELIMTLAAARTALRKKIGKAWQ